jgi:parvulin-like peptidyl-prolyl isomerase
VPAIAVVLVLVSGAWSARAQKPAGRPVSSAAAAASGEEFTGPAVATVGSSKLAKAELDARAQQALAKYRQANGERELPAEMFDLLRRQVIEGMIRMQLLAFEADRTGLHATREEEEAALKQTPVFNPGGKFDPGRFESARTNQKPLFEATLARIGRQIGAQRLYGSLESQYKPSEADAKAAATRQLTRALVEHFTLRAPEFTGTDPEPRELEIPAWYAAHRSQYARPDRAVLTVAFVNAPALADSLQAIPSRREAWSRRMRDVADSLLATMGHGADFDSITRALGPRASIVVQSDNFPGYWRGTPAQSAKLFDARNVGRAIPEPIAAADGWLLVRVDDVAPAHLAPLREVAREIRAELRRRSRGTHEEQDERALYAQLRDSLAGPGWRLRYAAIDTAALSLPRPSEAEIDHYYHGHQADYSSFDPGSGAIVVRPLAEVHDEIARRFLFEERNREGRVLREALVTAWSSGHRDPEAEARVIVHETPPLVPGSVIDTGLVATALADTLWHLGPKSGPVVAPYARGWIVWMLLDRADHVVPTLEQARPLLSGRLADRQDAEELAGARAYFARDSMRFHLGQMVHFKRFTVRPPDALKVPLTRAEVEKWHHDHLDRYSAAELVTARHILIRPASGSAAADEAARARAEELLKRAQAGEDFQRLAKAYSEDPATKDLGGDLGAFGRGTMLDAFEKAAFALKPGQICDHVVKTEVGYHIILCVDHVPPYFHPLPLIYSNVSSDAAHAKQEVLARERADSMMSVARTPAAMLALARREGEVVLAQDIALGSDVTAGALKPFFERIVRLRPGEEILAPFYMKGDGWWIAWLDSITSPVAPTWEQARARVMAEYKRGAGRRVLEAKQAEIDSLAAAGWSFDSLAALWGGPERALDVTPGRGIAGLGTSPVLDSLLFGTTRGEPLPLKTPSRWIALTGGLTRIRVNDRVPPSADQLAARSATLRSAELEHRLREYFDGLKERYPVRILDPRLRDVALADVPPGIGP